MVALERKRVAAEAPATGATPAKKSRSSRRVSLASRRSSHLPEINEIPQRAKSEVLDVFVWGTGSMCELGLGPEAKTKEVKRPRLNPLLHDIVDFAVGGMHTLALDKENKLWSWGNNDSGVLGRDTNLDGGAKLRDMDEDSDDEDGDLNAAESTPALVEGLPSELTIVQLAATDNLSLVLMSNGDVYAWGTFRCNEGILGFMGNILTQRTPLKIPLFVNIVQLASGKDHILGLDTKGFVFAWGNGQQFQLGRRIIERTRLQSLEPREFGLRNVKFIGSGEFHSFAITKDNKVYSWGLNQYGQCGIEIDIEDGAVIAKPTEIKELSDKKVKYITGGEHHTLALTDEGEVYGFGRYDMKEVGIPRKLLPKTGTFTDAHNNVRSIPVPTKLTTLPKISKIACGSHHNLTITEDGLVFSWGFADTYAVGLGNLDDDVENPTRIDNTATRNYEIKLIGAGGQFSVSAGTKLPDDKVELRTEKLEDFEEKVEEMLED